jgi:hypothetical protein
MTMPRPPMRDAATDASAKDKRINDKEPSRRRRNQETEKRRFDHKERKEHKTENDNRRLWPRNY